MNKTELISKIAEISGLSKVDAKKALEAGIAAVKETIKTAEIFNAAGQQLAAPQKGLNIIGGKKIWVKWEKNWAFSNFSERDRFGAKLKVYVK